MPSLYEYSFGVVYSTDIQLDLIKSKGYYTKSSEGVFIRLFHLKTVPWKLWKHKFVFVSVASKSCGSKKDILNEGVCYWPLNFDNHLHQKLQLGRAD